MKVYISFYGNLIRLRSTPAQTIEAWSLPTGTSIIEMMKARGISAAEVAFIQCEGKTVSFEYTPKNGDKIIMFGYVSGG